MTLINYLLGFPLTFENQKIELTDKFQQVYCCKMQHTTQFRLEYHSSFSAHVNCVTLLVLILRSPEDQTSAQFVGRNDMMSRRYCHYTAQTKCASNKGSSAL